MVHIVRCDVALQSEAAAWLSQRCTPDAVCHAGGLLQVWAPCTEHAMRYAWHTAHCMCRRPGHVSTRACCAGCPAGQADGGRRASCVRPQAGRGCGPAPARGRPARPRLGALLQHRRPHRLQRAGQLCGRQCCPGRLGQQAAQPGGPLPLGTRCSKSRELLAPVTPAAVLAVAAQACTGVWQTGASAAPACGSTPRSALPAPPLQHAPPALFRAHRREPCLIRPSPCTGRGSRHSAAGSVGRGGHGCGRPCPPGAAGSRGHGIHPTCTGARPARLQQAGARLGLHSACSLRQGALLQAWKGAAGAVRQQQGHWAPMIMHLQQL